VLRHAEAQIGFPLFRVVKGRLVPTEEAHVLFQEVCDLQGRIESLRETTKNLQRRVGGHLRLAMLPSLGLQVTPAAVAYDSPRPPRLAEVRIGSGELVLLFRKQDIPDPPARLSTETLKQFDLLRLAGTGSIETLIAGEIDVEWAGRAGISVESALCGSGPCAGGSGDRRGRRIHRPGDGGGRSGLPAAGKEVPLRCLLHPPGRSACVASGAGIHQGDAAVYRRKRIASGYGRLMPWYWTVSPSIA